MPKETDIQLKTVFLSTAARIFYKFSGLVIIALAAKRLGPKELGYFYFIAALISILIIISRFNVSPVIIRKLSRERSISIEYISNVLGFQLLTLLLSFGISLILGICLRLDIKIVILLFLCLALENLYIVFASMFVAHEKVKYNIFIGVTAKALLLILILVFLNRLTLLNFIYIQLSSNIFLFICALVIAVLKFGVAIPNLDYGKWSLLIKECMPFLLIETFTILLLKMDSVALGFFSTLQAVGYFGIIVSLKAGFELFPEGLQLILLPKMSMIFTERQKLKLLYRKYQDMYFCGGLLLAVLLFPSAKILIEKLFGDSFRPAIFPFRLVLITIPITFLSAINRMLFTAINKERRYLSFLKKMVFIKFILILAIIPHYGFFGGVAILILSDILELLYTQFYALKVFSNENT